jgi:PAS domain S-box-containing protein
MVSADGRIVCIRDEAVIIKDDEGNPLNLQGVMFDITERKKSQDRLSAIVYKSPIPTAVGGADGSIVTFNEALEDMIGYKASEISDVSDWVRKLYPDEEYREFVWGNVKQALDGRKQDCTQFTVTCKDGSTKIVNFHTSSFEDGLVVQMEDITERKRAEEALTESEEKFRNLADHSPNMIFINQQGRVVYANDKCEELMGYTKEEFYGPDFDFRSLIAPEFRDLVGKNFDTHMRGEEIAPYEYGMVNKKGERIHTILTTKLIKYEGQDAILGTVTDITERKVAEEKLTESAETIQAIFETSRDWIWSIDLNGFHTYCNPAIEGILGYRPEELTGKRSIDFMHEEDAKMVEEKLPDWVAQKSGWKNLEVRWRHKDGSYRFLESNSVPILSADGEFLGFRGVDRDITDRKGAEEGLKESEEHYQQLFEGMREGFALCEVIFDEKGEAVDYRLLKINPAFAEQSGMDIKATAGKTIKEVFEDIEPRWIQRYCNVAISQKPIHFIDYNHNTNRYYDAFAFPVAKDKFSMLFRDITNEHLAEEELHQHASIASSSSDMMAILDTNFVYLATNKAYLAAFGMTKDEIVGHTVSEVFGEEFFEKIIKPRATKCLRGDKIRYEDWFEFPAHGSRYMLITYSPYMGEDMKIKGFVVNGSDITERKGAEEALQESELRYRTFLEHFHGIAFRGKIDFEPVFLHGAVEDITGYTEEDFIGGNLRWDQIIYPQDLEVLSENIDNIGNTPNFSTEREYRIVKKDGTTRWVHECIRNICDESGKPGLVQGTIYDITERKRAEAERERLMEELDATNKELQSIVYTTSHDLQTPLVNIKGFGGELGKYCGQLNTLLESKTAGKDTAHQIETLLNEDIPEAIKFINAGTDKMRSLLDGLMHLSRIGETDLNITRLDMNHLMENVQRTMEYQIKEKQATVTIEKLPACMGDARQIDQVFGNLLDNSLKYLEKGRKGKIRISGQVEKGMSIYCVEDNGIGIADEHRDKIFQIFYRLDSATPSAGEGLGLTIVERILDRNNGRVRVESEVGKSSKFFVSLPHAKLSK